MEKLTNVAVLNDVLAGVPMTEAHIEKLTAMRDQFAKRNAYRSGKPTKAQEANAVIAEAVMSAMEAGKAYTLAEVKGIVPALADATPQKISPIMRGLKAAHRVTEVKVKGKVAYSIATMDEGEGE